MDPRIEKLADVLVNYSTGVKPGDLVLIRVLDPVAQPMALQVYKHVLKAGGNAVFAMSPRGASSVFYKYASDEQLDWLNPVTEWLYSNIDVMITLIADSNTKELTNVDPKRMARTRQTNAPLSKIFMERQGTGAM